MRSIYPLLIIALTLSAHAGNEGLDAIRARRQTMRRIEAPNCPTHGQRPHHQRLL